MRYELFACIYKMSKGMDQEMPTAKDVYDQPGQYWSFLTAPKDTDFEGQHFDRKEAGLNGHIWMGKFSNIQNTSQ